MQREVSSGAWGARSARQRVGRARYRGHLWATDVATHCVYRIDASTGQVLLTLGTGRPGAGPTAFNKPADVAVSERTDEVYVADGYGNARVAVFTYDGRFLRQWGAAGAGPGQFRVVHSVTLDAEDNVYVGDRENARVQVFSADGAYKTMWVSRVSTAGSRNSYAKHVSSITYHEHLDLFAVTEGDAVALRTPSGCALVETEGGLRWPHDALLVHSASLTGRPPINRSAVAHDGAQYALFVGELAGKSIRRFNAAGAGRAAGMGASPYG